MFDAVVTYYISGYQEVDSIGIFYDIPAGLELKSAEWVLEGGTMANINQTNRQAAWTVDKAVSLSKETAARAPTCGTTPARPAVPCGLSEKENKIESLPYGRLFCLSKAF